MSQSRCLHASRAIAATTILGLCFPSFFCVAQNDSIPPASDAWWKSLFRPLELPGCNPENPANPADSMDAMGLLDSSQTVSSDATNDRQGAGFFLSPASFEWTLPEGLDRLDSLDKHHPKALQGYRIQIYFGDLQEARSVRATFRRQHPNVACQLLPIAPNYAVTVGNYRDKWGAYRALRDEDMATWRHAIVIPSEIDLPPLH